MLKYYCVYHGDRNKGHMFGIESVPFACSIFLHFLNQYDMTFTDAVDVHLSTDWL